MSNDFSKIYDCLQSNNDYINYTIKNYINCYNFLDEKELEILTSIFSSLKTHSLESGNKIINSKIKDGIILSPQEGRRKKRDTSSLNKPLEDIGKRVESKKDILFYQSVVHLCNSIQYLSAPEMLDLNDLFKGIDNHKQFLGEKISDSDLKDFYPYDRSLRKYTK